MNRTTGSEPFTVTATIEGEASSGLAGFWQEYGTATVEGIGKVTIGTSMNGGVLFVMLPKPEGVGHTESPPLLYSIPVKALAEAAIEAAVARFREGTPAVWHETPSSMDSLDISAELDSLEKTPVEPGSRADRIRGERIGALRAEIAKREATPA